MMSKIPEVSAETLSYALERAREALSGDEAVERIADYYTIDSNWAGSLYLGIPDPDPSAITAADLLAVNSLNVKIPARAARRFLLEPGGAAAVTESLGALPEKTLGETDDDDLRLMETFYRTVRDSLTRAAVKKAGATKVAAPRMSGAWVTASKIVARKRPSLFPVRDRQVTTLLGTRKQKSYFTDWVVFRHLMMDTQITSDLERIADSLRSRPEQESYLFETEPLRLLDVALWTYAVKG